jgi:hypothetical protein
MNAQSAEKGIVLEKRKFVYLLKGIKIFLLAIGGENPLWDNIR